MTFDELLDGLLGPTGIPDRLRAVNSMLNPVEAVGQSMQASERLFAPETSGMGRVEAAGNMLSGMASVAAPALVASRAGVPAANALAETFTGLNMGAQDVGRAVVNRLNQPGDLGTLGSNGGNLARAVRAAPQTPAQEVAALLAAGRGAEVTDDLMARVDPQEMWRLYESGATGMDMPMDAASRAARAKEMGFEGPTYHGTTKEFQAFDLGQIGSANDHGFYGEGVYSSPNAALASDYAWDTSPKRGGRVLPIMTAGEHMPFNQSSTHSKKMTEAAFAGMQGAAPELPLRVADGPELGRFAAANGFNGVNVKVDALGAYDVNAPTHEVVTFDPRNIRSVFARFDPRLRHLANLSAAGAGVAVGNALAPSQNRHPYD